MVTNDIKMIHIFNEPVRLTVTVNSAGEKSIQFSAPRFDIYNVDVESLVSRIQEAMATQIEWEETENPDNWPKSLGSTSD